MRFLGLGGTDEVGASCYLYEFGDARLLIDAGMRPTMIGEESLPMLELLKNHPPDLMILSHAHLDHVGAIPRLKKLFPNLPIYTTRASRRLTLEVLTDAVKVAKAQGAMVYELGDAMQAIAEMHTIKPFEKYNFAGGQFSVYPAGHILGAVGILIETDEGKIFHTGDFSNITTLTTEEAYRPPTPIPVDAVISEATYGDTILPGRKEQIRELIEAVKTVIEGGGRVLIPTFALGRAQEIILLLLNHQSNGKLPKVPIYLDGLVRKLTTTFDELMEEMPQKLQNLAKNLKTSPFLRDNVVMVKDAKQRQRILEAYHPAIILASSGMLTGGPSPIYARYILKEVNSALFVVGYQDAESPGRRLLELERGGEVLLPSPEVEGFEPVPALCQVARYYLSAHADRVGIIAHLSRYPSPRVVFMHAEGNARYALMEALKKDSFVELPKNGEWVDLLAEITLPHLKKSDAPISEEAKSPSQAPPSQTGKIKRFKNEVDLEVQDSKVILSFDENISPEGLFENGRYRISVSKGSVIKAELRQKLELNKATPQQEEEAMDEEV